MNWLDIQMALLDSAIGTVEFAVNWLLQSTLLIAAGLTMGGLLRQRGSAVQSVIYRTTLVAVLLCPLVTWGLSLAGVNGWSLKMPQAWTYLSVESPDTETVEPTTNFAAESAVPAPTSPANLTVAAQDTPIINPLASDSFNLPEENEFSSDLSEPVVAESTIIVATTSKQFSIHHFGLLATVVTGIWLLGSFWLMAKLGKAWLRLTKLRQQAVGADATTVDICCELAAQLAVNTPQVLRSPFLPSPCLTGIRRPAVLLPEIDPSLSLRDVLIHELAHLRRRDCHWNLLRQLATAMFFFQPLLWKLSRRLEATAEEVCDDFVVQLGGNRHEYAHRLVDIAELSSVPLAATGVGIVSFRSMLAQRVTRIMDTSRTLSTRVGNLLLVLVLAGGLIGTTVVGFVGLGSHPSETVVASIADDSDVATDGEGDVASLEEASVVATDENDVITVRGTVVDPDGKPVAKATVQITRWYWDPDVPKIPLATTTSGADGRFEISYRKSQFNVDVQNQDMWKHVTIIATAEEFGPAWIGRDKLKPDEEPLLRLVPDDVPITGRVVDLEGNPLAGIKVSVGGLVAAADENLDPWLEALGRGEILWEASNRHLGKYTPYNPASIPAVVRTKADGSFLIEGVGRERRISVAFEGPTIAYTRATIVTRRMEPILANDGMPDPEWSRKTTVYGADFQIAVHPTQPIIGAIRDAETGDPMPGVAVESYRMVERGMSAERLIRVKSDEQGRYRLVGMPKGPGKQIIAVPNDEQPYLMREFDIPDKPGLEPIEIDLELHQGVWVTGRVTDKTTIEPVPVRVYFLPFRSNPFAQALPEFDDNGNTDGYQQRYTTDGEGIYRVVGIPGRAIVGVQCVAKPYAKGMGHEAIDGIGENGHFPTYNNPIQPSRKWPTAMKEIVIAEGAEQEQLDFQLYAGRSIRLSVVDGRGVALNALDVVGLHDSEGWRAVKSSVFDVIALKPNEERQTLIHHKERNLGKIIPVRATADPPDSITVRLKPCATIRGQLVDDNEQPVTGARVRLGPRPGGDFSPELKSVATDAEGRFEHTEVLPGADYNVMSESAQIGFKAIAKDLAVQPGETIDLGTIDITSDKRPEPVRMKAGAPVDVNASSNRSVKEKTTAGEKSKVKSAVATIRQQVAVKGRVTLEDSEPAAGAHVAVIAMRSSARRGGDLSPDSEVLADGETDENGNYHLSFTGASSKTHRNANLIARKNGAAVVWKQLNLDAASVELTLELPPEELITGKLVDIEGQPAAGVRLQIRGVMNSASLGFISRDGVGYRGGDVIPKAWLQSVTTDDLGQFTLHGISAGHGALLHVVGSDRFAPQEISLNTGMPEQRGERDGTYRPLVKNIQAGEEAVLPLAPAQLFEGVVTYEDTGEPASHARLTIWASQEEFGSMVSVAGAADAEGRYRMSPNPGTRFGVTAYPQEDVPYLTRRTPLDESISWKSGDRVKQVDIALPRGVLVKGRVVESGSDTPVVGATIQYVPESANNPNTADDILTGWQGIQLSNDQGRFEIVVLPGPGRLLVHGPQGKYVFQEIASRQLSDGKPGGRRNYVHAVQKVDPQIDADPIEVAIPLSPGITARGRIVDERGESVGEALVITRLITLPHSLTWRGQMPPTIGGQFEVPGLEEGAEYPVHILDAKRRLGATAIIRADSKDTVVVLKPCGQASDRYIDAEGEPHVGFRPGLHLVVTPGAHEHDYKAARRGELLADADFVSNIDRTNYWPGPETDDQGQVVFPALIPGATYRLSSYEDGKPKILRQFTVEAGEQLDLGEFEIELND